MNGSRRILVNTGALYAKIVINTILVLLSARYILAALGVVDYGLYAVIGGVMGFMGFLTSAMATSSQRHLTYELGRGDIAQLGRVFNVCFGLHALLALLIVVLGETLGLWFLNNILSIPEARQDAAFWVFQFTVVASVCYVMAVPYQALLTAHEALTFIALVGIIQSVLTFVLALWLVGYVGDRLKIYALLSCATAASVTLVQVAYSQCRYSESKLHKASFLDKDIVKELASFSGWSLFGSLAVVTRSHGVAFLLNIYFGPLANAALGIANQVYGAISQFTQAILQVVSPRLVKHEGAGNREHMLSLALLICKYSFFIGCMWAIPLFAEIPAILTVWLKNPPENSATFCRFIIALYICDQLSAGLSVPAQAIGKIARIQTIGSIVHLSTIPLAFILIIWGGDESMVLLASLLTACLNMLLRGYLLKSVADFSYGKWLKEVVFRGFMTVLPSVIIVYALVTLVESSLFRLISIVVSSIIMNAFCVSLFGMTNGERSRFVSAFKTSRKAN